ncbi:hypothetical protein GOP47_0022186 [Adiantum capillus-veneris]|uniref:Uncharacterized protein n=1 Tax=Adiantum capillus-veneris TaxID=13818 RepID=A0A9D4Z6V8_ADICA|nr:hypothetical protein GOP47_0022186 [Adiantum capillus-veneris]
MGPSKKIQALKNFNTMAAMLMEKQKHEELGHHQQFSNNNTSEESSDFSTELDAIVRQDRGHTYYGAFPSRDIIKVNNNWMMNSPDSMRNDSVEFMHLFRQGIDKYGVSESPLVCQHGALGNCDKCNSLSGRGSRSFGEGWKPSPLSGSMSAIYKNPQELWKGSPY